MAIPPVAHPRPPENPPPSKRAKLDPTEITSVATPILAAPKETIKDKGKSERNFEATVKENPSTTPLETPNLIMLKDYVAHVRKENNASFQTRMEQFFRIFRRESDGSCSLLLEHPNNEDKILIHIAVEASKAVFSTGVTATSPVYHLTLFENEEDNPNLELRFTADGKYGEIVQIVSTDTLRGDKLRDIYLSLEPLFKGEWCVKDNAIKKWELGSEQFELCLRFCALGNTKTWFQRSFGYDTVAHTYEQNSDDYHHALATIRSFRVSLVWSFMKQDEGNAVTLQYLCNRAFRKDDKEIVFAHDCDKTLQELYATVMKESLCPKHLCLEDQADLQQILFYPPESFKENGHSTETIYWKAIRVLRDTKVFKKYLS